MLHSALCSIGELTDQLYIMISLSDHWLFLEKSSFVIEVFCLASSCLTPTYSTYSISNFDFLSDPHFLVLKSRFVGTCNRPLSRCYSWVRHNIHMGLGSTLSFTLFLSLPHPNSWQKEIIKKSCSRWNCAKPASPHCCLYRKSSKKHRMAIVVVCNRDSSYCFSYRLKARERERRERVQDKREWLVEQGSIKKKRKKGLSSESTIEL